MNNIGHLNCVPLKRNFTGYAGWTDCKELEIETGNEMEFLFQQLPIFNTNPLPKAFIMTYLNQPHPHTGITQIATLFVHFDIG